MAAAVGACTVDHQALHHQSFVMQGNVYDDDEEYGDTLDDGGDDGATY